MEANRTMSQARTTASPTPPHAEYFPRPRGDGGPMHWLALLVDERRQLIRYWPVVQNMVRQELHVRYQRSVLGFLWTLLHPILMMTTMTIAFSQIFNISGTAYAVYLFSGMVPWTFLQGSINECAYTYIHNEGLIRKIYLPKLIFPLIRVLINLITFVLSMTALFVMLIPIGARPSWAMLALPVAVLLLTMFAMGLGLLVATANTFFRDLGHLVSVVLQAWYFLTPIVYEASVFKSGAAKFWLNPAYPFVRMFQTIIRDAAWPDPTTLGAAAGIAVVSLGIGYVAFKSQEQKLVFRL
jgi:ABC-2 type transport system permease protein/lipopolysaccharide transport system permease protein